MSNPAAAMTATKPRYQAEQLELRFEPHVTVDMQIDRLADGRILISHATDLKLWGSTQDAADQLGKSRQWVRDALEAKLLRGERVGKCWRVDMMHVQELRKRSRNW